MSIFTDSHSQSYSTTTTRPDGIKSLRIGCSENLGLNKRKF